MQGAGSLESRVADITQNGSTTKAWDARVSVIDYDGFHNAREMAVQPVGVNRTMHITRTVQNHLSIVNAKWRVYEPKLPYLGGADPVIGILKSFSEPFWRRDDLG